MASTLWHKSCLVTLKSLLGSHNGKWLAYDRNCLNMNTFHKPLNSNLNHHGWVWWWVSVYSSVLKVMMPLRGVRPRGMPHQVGYRVEAKVTPWGEVTAGTTWSHIDSAHIDLGPASGIVEKDLRCKVMSITNQCLGQTFVLRILDMPMGDIFCNRAWHK